MWWGRSTALSYILKTFKVKQSFFISLATSFELGKESVAHHLCEQPQLHHCLWRQNLNVLTFFFFSTLNIIQLVFKIVHLIKSVQYCEYILYTWLWSCVFLPWSIQQIWYQRPVFFACGTEEGWWDQYHS